MFALHRGCDSLTAHPRNHVGGTLNIKRHMPSQLMKKALRIDIALTIVCCGCRSDASPPVTPTTSTSAAKPASGPTNSDASYVVRMDSLQDVPLEIRRRFAALSCNKVAKNS